MTAAARASVGPLPRAEVPWLLVISLAATLAYADGFWTTSLRGAVGAIERTQSPFSSWLWESTLTVPMFAAAVLGALTLALRWFGPGPLRWRSWIAVTLLIVAAGTLAGVVELAVSEGYDYRLQVRHLVAMSDTCTGACLATQQQATLDLQLKALGYGTLLLLVSNLVLVLWVLALAGGRLAVATTRRRALSASPRTRADDLRLVLTFGLVGAATVHVAVVPEHLAAWPAAGAFFVVLALAQLATAALTLRHPGRDVWLAAAGLSAATLILWLASRTLGLPFGPDAGAREPVGLADLAAGALEAATLVAGVMLLRMRDGRRRALPSAHPGRLALTALVAVTVLGLGGGLHLMGGTVSTHEGPAPTGTAR